VAPVGILALMSGGAASVSLRVPGGDAGPRTARLQVLSALDGALSERELTDVGLLVSELVTNSVRHAGVGADGTITVDLWMRGDRLRLSVTDPGGPSLPRLIDSSPERPGGLGLFWSSGCRRPGAWLAIGPA